MDENSRGYKIICKIGPLRSNTHQLSEQNELSIAIQNLEKECSKAEEILQGNFDANDDEDIFGDINLNTTKDLEDLLDVDRLNGAFDEEPQPEIVQKNQEYTASNENVTSDEISLNEDYQNDLDEEVESDSSNDRSTEDVGFGGKSQYLFMQTKLNNR